MASVVLGAVGSMIGGPIGGMLGGTLGRVIDGMLFQQHHKLPWIDTQVMASTMGLPVPRCYGRCKVAGNLIQSTELTKKHGGGKKGGGGGKSGGKGSSMGKGQQQDQYYANCAVAVCEGPIQNIWRIWADQKLIWDADPQDLTNIDKSYVTYTGGLSIGFGDGAGAQIQGNTGKGGGSDAGDTSHSFGSARIYLGTEDQTADPFLVSMSNQRLTSDMQDSQPAYRGLAYIVFQDFNVTNFGDRVPNFQFEINGFHSGPIEWNGPVSNTNIFQAFF